MECNDTETGEYKGIGWLISSSKKGRGAFRTGFTMVADIPVNDIVADKDLTNSAVRVFLGVLANMGYQNAALINQSELAKKINLDRPSVSRALKILVEKGYVSVTERGRMKLYSVNPAVAFKGRPKRRGDNG